jgi:hypothetical protein
MYPVFARMLFSIFLPFPSLDMLPLLPATGKDALMVL